MATRFGYNSTIARKEKICRSCGKPCYPFSKGRCQPCSTREDTMKRMEAATEEMIKEEDLSDIIKDLDAVYSRWLRMKYANDKGVVRCYTCSTEKHFSLMQTGHFVPRAHLFFRWDDRFTRVQCPYCNENLSGNLSVFAANLEKEMPGCMDIIQEERQIIFKPTKSELKQLIADYASKSKALKSKLK